MPRKPTFIQSILDQLADGDPHFVAQIMRAIFGRPESPDRQRYLLQRVHNAIRKLESKEMVRTGRAMLWNTSAKEWRSQGTVAWLANSETPRWIQVSSIKLPIVTNNQTEPPPPPDIRNKAASILPALLRRIGIEGLAQELEISPRSVYRWSRGQLKPTRKHAAHMLDVYHRTNPVQADHF